MKKIINYILKYIIAVFLFVFGIYCLITHGIDSIGVLSFVFSFVFSFGLFFKINLLRKITILFLILIACLFVFATYPPFDNNFYTQEELDKRFCLFLGREAIIILMIFLIRKPYTKYGFKEHPVTIKIKEAVLRLKEQR